MFTNWYFCILTGILLGAGIYDLTAQTSLSRSELEDRIAIADRLLSETRNRESRSLITLRTLNRQIGMRRQLIDRLASELDDKLAEIERHEMVRCEMEGDKKRIEDNYRQALQAAYKELGSDNIWLSILSADNLTDAYFRLQYYRQFTSYCEQQLKLMRQTEADLDRQAHRLNEEFIEKDRLIAQRQDELMALEENRQEQRRLYRELKSEIDRYQSMLAEERHQLQELIQETENVYEASNTSAIAANYAEQFPQRKGQLPWPVARERSLIVGHYGRGEDPFGNPITYDGIVIRTPQGEEVSSVHAGRVTGLTNLPLLGGWVVIVEHGRYRTVYSNLERVFVQEGQLITADQPLGLVRTDHRTGETVFQFMIYTLPNRFLNPERWLER